MAGEYVRMMQDMYENNKLLYEDLVCWFFNSLHDAQVIERINNHLNLYYLHRIQCLEKRPT